MNVHHLVKRRANKKIKGVNHFPDVGKMVDWQKIDTRHAE
jgi:hypothetical protein